jgi:NADH-quinone oxidoreductase subunit J
MLLEPRGASGSARYSRLLVPGIAGLVLLLGVIVASIWRPLPSPTVEIGATEYGIAGFSIAFLGRYWLLFELTSVLLLAAVVAALAVIRVGRDASVGRQRG